MRDGYVRELTDGEELVVEMTSRRVNDDPRERTIETLRQVFFDEPLKSEVNGW